MAGPGPLHGGLHLVHLRHLLLGRPQRRPLRRPPRAWLHPAAPPLRDAGGALPNPPRVHRAQWEPARLRRGQGPLPREFQQHRRLQACQVLDAGHLPESRLPMFLCQLHLLSATPLYKDSTSARKFWFHQGIWSCCVLMLAQEMISF